MKNIGYCFLAIGDRYVDEFISISKHFPKENIIVCSDREIAGYNTIVTKEPFNFHLRALAIERALKEYDTVVALDTDHVITSLDKNIFYDALNGISVKWVGDSVTYLEEKITSKDLINSNTKFDDVNLYGSTLYKIINSEVKFLDESIMIFKLNDEEKELFLENYFDIISKTKEKQPFRYTDKKMGALEGCIIYSAAVLSNIEINAEKSDDLNSYFYHYGPKIGHTLKLNKNKSLI